MTCGFNRRTYRWTPWRAITCLGVGAFGWLTAAQPLESIAAQPPTLPAQEQLSPGQDRLLTPPPGPTPQVVQVAFHLEDIDNIDDEHETFEFSGVLSLTWQDPRQAFDPAISGLTEKVFQGNYQFDEIAPGWYPQVYLANASGDLETAAVALRVAPDGTCTLTQSILASAEAKLNLRRYPFDRQRLELIFELFGFAQSEVQLQSQSPAVLEPISTAIRIPQWEVTGVDAACRQRQVLAGRGPQLVSAFVVEIVIQRRSLFMLRLVVIPLMLIVVLSWSVFWMDRSSLGDRINVSFIGILTAVAYQIVVSGILPQISYVTWMNSFLNISFWVMCATVVINIVVGEVDKRGQLARGDRIDHYCRWIFPLVYIGLLLSAGLIVSRLD